MWLLKVLVCCGGFLFVWLVFCLFAVFGDESSSRAVSCIVITDPGKQGPLQRQGGAGSLSLLTAPSDSTSLKRCWNLFCH